MVCHQSPSESLVWFSAVLFDPGEGTTCVPLITAPNTDNEIVLVTTLAKTSSSISQKQFLYQHNLVTRLGWRRAVCIFRK